MKEVHDHSFNVNAATAIGHEKAILLKELYYWCQQNFNNQRNFHHGLYWTYNTAEAFVLKFPYFSRRSIARWLQQMEQDGYIGSLLLNKKGYDRTKWYCVNEEAYVAMCSGSKPSSLDYFKKYITNLATSIGQNGQTNGQNGESFSQNGQPIPPLNPSLNQSPFIEPENKNDLLVETVKEVDGFIESTYEIIKNDDEPFDLEGNKITVLPDKEQTPPPNSEAPPAPKKWVSKEEIEERKTKRKKYIHPPTIEELVQPIYEKLLEKKRQHPNIVDCWNWANHQAEAFWLYHDKTGWKIEKLNSAIATWINKAIQYKTVVVPCPIQYKGNPANAQPAQPTKVHVEQPILTQQDIEASEQHFAGVRAMFKQMGV